MVCSDKRLKYFFNELELKEVLREESQRAKRFLSKGEVSFNF